MKRHFRCVLVMALLLAWAGSIPVQAVDSNLSFGGTLVSEPCDLDPNTTDVKVDFSSMIDKYLYINTRTHYQPFTINLINCDISLGNKVSLTFKGTESAALPGLLAVTGPAKGIAIGMTDQSGLLLPFNQTTSLLTLNSGINSFTFMSYVEGEPDAIKNKAITMGFFSAVATFEINYP